MPQDYTHIIIAKILSYDIAYTKILPYNRTIMYYMIGLIYYHIIVAYNRTMLRYYHII